MIYELMHKDVVVADVEIDSFGTLLRIVSVHHKDHFPFGTEPVQSTTDATKLRHWWGNRRIPLSRDDVRHFVDTFLPKSQDLGTLLLSCHGLSLSDCYWIREKGDGVSFANINFFENDYSYDLGDALFRHKGAAQSFFSPDATSEGNLKKRWKIIDGKRVLIKSGSLPHRYEVFHEVIVSSVCAALGIPHVEYRLLEDGDDIYCACDDFLGYSQDFVTAYMIFQAGDKRNDESAYAFLIRKYKELGIQDAALRIQQMLLVDFILGNEDRHLNNFGLLRDANSLKFVGVAPIFDNGSCLCFDKDDSFLEHAVETSWKPFATRSKPSPLDYLDQLPLSSSRLLFAVMPAIRASCVSMSPYLSSKRINAIYRFVARRVAMIAERFHVDKETNPFSLGPTQKRIIEYIQSHGGRLDKADELCLALGISRITAIRNLVTLTEQGLLKRVGSRKNGHWERA